MMRITCATRLWIPILAAMVMLGGCATKAQRNEAQSEAVQRETAREVRRICALPPAEREAELETIEAESGIVLHCGGE
jgi:hypothetical protein